MAKDESFYNLIQQQCNADQIRELLREFKDINKITRKEVILGGSKESLIKVLSRNISLGHIPFDRALNLLRDCEENGQQHIFYFRPKNKRVRDVCRDYDGILENLIGEEWNEGYPLYEFVPDDYQWVDFRRGLYGKPRDWIFKAYGQENRYERTEVKRPTATSRVEYFEAKVVRVVCVVRWNDPDLLEIRIDSQGLDSVVARDARRNKLWQLLANALTPQDFVEWDLRPARSYMAANRTGHSDFVLGDIRLSVEDGGTATFKTSTEAESVDSLEVRSEAINVLTSNEKTQCDVLCVHWNGEVIGTGNGQITTICGGKYTHELIVRARTTPAVLDNVTNKLRIFCG